MADNLRFKNLAVSETGFVFDPQTGNSFVVNQLGIEILNCFKKDMNEKEIIQYILDNYEINYDQVKRDFDNFLLKLNQYGLYNLANGK